MTGGKEDISFEAMAGSRTWNYTLTHILNEKHSRPIYCVSFNQVDPAHKRLFASCGDSRVRHHTNHLSWQQQWLASILSFLILSQLLFFQATIYECQDTEVVCPLQCYQDESVSFFRPM